MICDAESANVDLRPGLGFLGIAARAGCSDQSESSEPASALPADGRAAPHTASIGAGGGRFQKRSDVSFLRVITPRLA